MISLKFTDILKRNHELGQKLTGSEYNIGIISNITINQIKEVLELNLREENINANVITGDYDTIVQDSSHFSQSDTVVVFWEAGNLVEGLHNKAHLMTEEDLDVLVCRVENEIELVLRNLKNTPLVLINKFSSFLFYSDPLRNEPLARLCKRLNAVLESKVTSNQIIVDIEMVFATVGLDKCADFRQFLSSKALYSLEFFKAYTEAVTPALLTATGNSKKILVLDCDNTLWGGILGEDGPFGIRMNDMTSQGKAFLEVQTILRGLRKEGVLLALCSKNNFSDVEQVFLEHPDMILKEEDFVAKKINWLDKATNLRELAIELNLGLDSFVFIDDSAFEIGLIQKELPHVKCIQVPKQLSEYPTLVRRLRSNFFLLSKSVEDERKTKMYQEERHRKANVSQFSSIDEYLRSLQLKLTIYWDADIPVSRVAQMSQKTNQFNLTTRRYTEAEIQRMLADPLYTLAAFSVSDLYGDYGVTGMAVVRNNEEFSNNWVVDSFLISCRVIGRNIEYAFFDELVHTLRTRNINRLHGEYLTTAKNSQVEMFYDTLGFTRTLDKENGKDYMIYLSDYKGQDIKYIDII